MSTGRLSTVQCRPIFGCFKISMPIPDYQSLMRPILEVLSKCDESTLSGVCQKLGEHLDLSEEDMAKEISSGNQPIIKNRASWALFHLKGAKFVDRVSRGVYQITEGGKKALKKKPGRIDFAYLQQVSAYAEWLETRQTSNSDNSTSEVSASTPHEKISEVAGELNKALKSRVLDEVLSKNDKFFEKLSVNLINTILFGENNNLAQVTGRSGDGGIDGKLMRDELGLDKVYLQAKRYQERTPVRSGEMRDFIGALDIENTDRGVFITTSKFTKKAEETARQASKQIILIDGDKITELMIKHNVGVKVQEKYEVKEIDANFFSDL